MTKLKETSLKSAPRRKSLAQDLRVGAALGNQDALLKARRHDAALRNLLLGGVAAGIAMFGYGRVVYAACVPVGNTITCTGDLSLTTVAATGPTTVLNVNSLTANIAPGTNVDGISFSSAGAITIVSDTGEFEIIASGVAAIGIEAEATGGGAVSITHTGDITSGGTRGIDAYSNGGTVTTVSTGDIQAENEGIYAYTNGVGAVNVTHTGDITSDTDQGIEARSDDGAVTTVSTGNIQAEDQGIYLRTSSASALSVTHTGEITSDNAEGIRAISDTGTVTTVSTGNIQAENQGIRAVTSGVAAVSVTHTGDITSDTNRGIDALSGTGITGGTVTTVSAGDVQADTDGIAASSRGASAVSVTHTGDITAGTNRGIYASSNGGAVTTVSTGDIQADNEGIFAHTDVAGAVSVTHTGDITSDNNRGIEAQSGSVATGGAVTTVSTGTIQADFEGIYARTRGPGEVSVTHTGDITSDDDQGIYARSSGGTVTTVSTGNIQAENQGIFALTSGTADVSVTHTGDITSETNRGIFAQSNGGSVAITLGDGVVEGGDGFVPGTNGAITANSATGTELTLNAGSVLIGSINITGAAVLNTGPGLSIAHTFTGTVPSIGNVSGNVAVISGTQIAVADISGLAAADNQLSDTLDGVSGVLAASQHREAGNWWISGFGGFGVTDAVDNSVETKHKYGGLVAGTFALLDNGVQLGVFAGAAKGAHTAEITNGLSGSSNSYFAGINGRFAAELFALDFAVIAGMSSNEGERIIANNTVATGLETALSSFDSYFIAPEITLSTAPIKIQDFNFIPSLRVRYEAMQSGGFTETGVTAGGIIAGDAISHAANIRLQGAVPIDLNILGATLMARGGVDTRFASSSGNDVTLMGVVTSDAGANDEFSARGFAGLDFSHAFSEYASLTASGELRAGTTGFSASASLGLKGKF